MAKTFIKIAGSTGTTDQVYANRDKTSELLTVKHKFVDVPGGNSKTRIVKTIITIRDDIAGKSCGTDVCPPVFPALLRLEASAPEGALPADYQSVIDAAVVAFKAALNSVFFPNIDTINVP